MFGEEGFALTIILNNFSLSRMLFRTLLLTKKYKRLTMKFFSDNYRSEYVKVIQLLELIKEANVELQDNQALTTVLDSANNSISST